MTLNNIQYAAIMAVTLTVLITSQSAFAADITVNPGDDIQTILTATRDGDVVTFADGTYHDVGHMRVTKQITLTSETGDFRDSAAIFTGYVSFELKNNNISIKGLEFKDNTNGIADGQKPFIVGSSNLKRSMNNITFSDNLFEDTKASPIAMRVFPRDDYVNATEPEYLVNNLLVSNNRFINIGYNTPDLFNGNGSLAKIHDTTAISLDDLKDSVIVGNHIDGVTYSGISIKFPQGNVTVTDNYIKKAGKSAITSGGSITPAIISDNTIIGANLISNTHNPPYNGGAGPANAAIRVGQGILYNNDISGSFNGVMVCRGPCDPTNFKQTERSTLNQARHAEPVEFPLKVVMFNNTIHDNFGLSLINSENNPVIAQYNYWGSAEPTVFDTANLPLDTPTMDTHKVKNAADFYGKVISNPFWTDKVGGTLESDGTTTQFTSADVANKNFICSITLEKFNLIFENASWGGVSDPITNSVLNAGQQVLTGVKLTSEGWKDGNGVLVTGAETYVDNAFIRFSGVAGGIERTVAGGATNLPKPGTDDKLDLEFVLNLSKRASGPDSEIYQTVKYAGTCS